MPVSAAVAGTEHESLSQRASRSIKHPLARTLLVLTFTTGLVDAVSYLGLGRVFTANMTGNIVFLGFGIAGSGGLPVVAPLISLGAFLLGAGAGAFSPREWQITMLATSPRRSRSRCPCLQWRSWWPRPSKYTECCIGRRGDRAASAGDGRAQRDDPPDRRPGPHHDGAHDDADRPGRRLPSVRGHRQGLDATDRCGARDALRRPGRGAAVEDESCPPASRRGCAGARHIAPLRPRSSPRGMTGRRSCVAACVAQRGELDSRRRAQPIERRLSDGSGER